MNESPTFAIRRNGSYLAHYGISGMKWYRRRYQNEDGSYTPAGRMRYGIGQEQDKKQARQYIHDMRKLKKLHDRTDKELQAQNIEKYDRRAKKAMKVGNIASGVAAVTLGGASGLKYYNKIRKAATAEKAKGLLDQADQARRDSEKAVRALWSKDSQAYDQFGKWTGKGYSDATKKKVDQLVDDYMKKDDQLMSERRNIISDFNKKAKVRQTVSKVAQITGIVAAATAAGAYGTAAYSKIQSQLAKKRLTDIGHDKAVQKYKEQYQKMLSTYANTPLSAAMKEEIRAYKKEHPGTQLTDKQIMKNLS